MKTPTVWTPEQQETFKETIKAVFRIIHQERNEEKVNSNLCKALSITEEILAWRLELNEQERLLMNIKTLSR